MGMGDEEMVPRSQGQLWDWTDSQSAEENGLSAVLSPQGAEHTQPAAEEA